MERNCVVQSNAPLFSFGFACLLVFFSMPAYASIRTVDCTGATAGAFKSLQAAIDSLNFVGPHEIDVIAGPCNENIVINNRQRLTITAPGVVSINSAVGTDGNVMTIQGSTAIQLVQLGFTGGTNGIRIQRNSEVSVRACTISGNNQGVAVRENSTVLLDGDLISGNANNGVLAQSSTLTIQGSTFENNGFRGITLRLSRAVFQGFNGTNIVQGNGEGIGLVNQSSAEFDAPNFIQNNQIGLEVGDGSSARLLGDVAPDGNPIPNVITGNSFIGLNGFAGQSFLLGATQITNNGFGGRAFHAGVRVDDNASFLASGTGDIQVANNSGPGIAVTAGGNVDVAGIVVSHNSEDGINLVGNAQVTFLPPNTNVLDGNGGAAINCDSTSVFAGDKTGVNKVACHITEIRPESAQEAGRASMRDAAEEERPTKLRRK